MTLAELPYTISDLFPAGDFAFHMRFRRGDIEQFYKNNAVHADIIAERKKWLAQDAHKYAAALPESAPLLNEALDFAKSVGIHTSKGATLLETMLNLGGAWEPDLLLLKCPSIAEQPVLLAGCVCFPSSWALEEKIGRPLDAIHGPVPTLNQQFANPVQQFLARIKPGISWERINWGLSRSPELNQHPSRQLPRLGGPRGGEHGPCRIIDPGEDRRARPRPEPGRPAPGRHRGEEARRNRPDRRAAGRATLQ